MPAYIFSYRSSPAAVKAQSPEEARKGAARFDAWVESLGESAIVPGTPIKDCHEVTSRGTSADPEAVCLMGFSIIRAESMAAALEIAQACPHLEWGPIEVGEAIEGRSARTQTPGA